VRLKSGAVPTKCKLPDNDVALSVEVTTTDEHSDNHNDKRTGTDHSYCTMSSTLPNYRYANINADAAADDDDDLENGDDMKCEDTEHNFNTCLVHLPISSSTVHTEAINSDTTNKAHIKRAALQDHHYFVKDSPRFLKRKLTESCAHILSQRKNVE